MTSSRLPNTLVRIGLNLALSPVALLLPTLAPAAAGTPDALASTIAHDRGGDREMDGNGPHGGGHHNPHNMDGDGPHHSPHGDGPHGGGHHNTDGNGPHGGGHHHHGTLEVPANLPVPAVEASIEADTASGWNLEIRTENFELTGEAVGDANVDGEGHAHVYANGVKIARVYGNWYHIPELPAGEVELRVTLNSNQHEMLTRNGEPIAASATVTVAP